MSITIHPDEVIVGNRSLLPRMGVIAPEGAVDWVDKELDNLPTRPQDPFNVAPEVIEELRTAIFPYWRGKTLEDTVAQRVPEDVRRAVTGKAFSLNQTDHAQGHILPDVEGWLRLVRAYIVLGERDYRDSYVRSDETFRKLFAIFSLVPPIYMLITSLKGSAEISAATNPWWVFHPTLENYAALLGSSQYLRFFLNSAMVSIFVVTITMLISVPAAFALARMKFWGSATLATGVFLTYLIPDSLLFIPLFKMFAVIGDWTGIQLINRWYVLLFIYPTLTVPFCTWIMIGYFASIPKELDEAAIIDGASWIQTLTRIFIPVALPGLIAATIFAFTVSWAQFLYPMVFTTSVDQLVLPAGIITTLIKGDVFNWGQIMTGALLGAAPPLIIYAFLMDYYIAGLTAGATKG